MENTDKEDKKIDEEVVKEEKQDESKNELKKELRKVPIHVSVGNFLLAIFVILIVSTGSLVYYMIATAKRDAQEYTNMIQNIAESQEAEDENVETIKNIIDSTINTSAGSTETNTVDAVDATSRKVMNENLIVLYNGLILDTTKMAQTELKYIDNSDKYKDKYVITYYNYESFGFKDSKLGTLSSQVYDGLVKIDNVGKVAISESYDAIPREIKIVNAIPTIVSDKNSKIGDYDSTKTIIADLDGNGTDEYILILANKQTGYSKITLMESSGTKVADLAYIEKSKWESVTTEEYHLSLSNVELIDVDNDGIMEILIEIPRYEGDPTVSLLKYKNGELSGDKNIECSLLP